MTSYRDLLKQHAELQREIDAAHEKEITLAIEKVWELVREYSLTPEQIFSERKGKSELGRGTKPAKYRDPVSGATWSGMGREPLWIKEQPRERFLINP